MNVELDFCPSTEMAASPKNADNITKVKISHFFTAAPLPERSDRSTASVT
jgi:hypothetical protein